MYILFGFSIVRLLDVVFTSEASESWPSPLSSGMEAYLRALGNIFVYADFLIPCISG